jgi:CRP-like cAMP-binding protein
MPFSDPALLEQLRNLHLLSGLSDEQFARVIAGAQQVSLSGDQVLFGQGAPAERFYFLRRGFMKLSRLSAAGEEKVIEFIQPGHTFAEALMFGGAAAYPVTATAVEPSEVVSLENRPFLALLQESPDTCLRLLAGMSRRMHGLLAEIDRLALQSATSRVAGFLLSAAEGDAVELRTPKHMLASRLSITPETLSRIFARLSAGGVLRVQGTRIVLLRVEELRRIVETGEG